MIKLSKRLNAISNYIDDNDRLIDVGCDHALLDIFLVKNKKNVFCIASDNKDTALEQARKNINKYNITKNIEVRCGNGLSTISSKDSINTIIISGMGYQTILKILKENKEKLMNINKLIIQSNNYPEIIRKNVIKMGFYIFDEKIIKDNNIFYTIIVFKKGFKKYSKKEIKLGPILLSNKDSLFSELIEFEINRNKILKSIIPHKYLIKRIKIHNYLKLLLKEKKS